MYLPTRSKLQQNSPLLSVGRKIPTSPCLPTGSVLPRLSYIKMRKLSPAGLSRTSCDRRVCNKTLRTIRNTQVRPCSCLLGHPRGKGGLHAFFVRLSLGRGPHPPRGHYPSQNCPHCLREGWLLVLSLVLYGAVTASF